MAERIQEYKRETPEGTATKTTRITDDTYVAPQATKSDRVDGVSTAARIVWFITGILLTLLAFRFVLVLLGANPQNAFANFIYSASNPFAAPFYGLFGYSLHYGVSRLEISTLVAMAVYALIAYAIVKLLTIRKR